MSFMKVFRSPHLGAEATKYLIVGAFGYLVDVALFNVLRSASWVPDFLSEPVVAKVASTVVAVSMTYIANSRWTFTMRTGRPRGLLQFTLFFVVNLIGLLISVMCLWISHYLLGFTNVLADNISANFIGIGLATIFRFVANRKWVFLKPPSNAEGQLIQV